MNKSNIDKLIKNVETNKSQPSDRKMFYLENFGFFLVYVLIAYYFFSSFNRKTVITVSEVKKINSTSNFKY